MRESESESEIKSVAPPVSYREKCLSIQSESERKSSVRVKVRVQRLLYLTEI